jgi:hypothetical protein
MLGPPLPTKGDMGGGRYSREPGVLAPLPSIAPLEGDRCLTWGRVIVPLPLVA